MGGAASGILAQRLFRKARATAQPCQDQIYSRPCISRKLIRKSSDASFSEHDVRTAIARRPRKQHRQNLRERQAAQFGVKNPNENLICASARFFVFVAGVYRNQDYTFSSPLLGMHRPYLSESDLKGLFVDQTMETAARTRAIVESYRREMSVRPIYADQMFSRSPCGLRTVTS
jgi:hypothetical protein